MSAMVAQATAAAKVNSKSVVLVQLDQVDQVLVQAGTLDQVVTHARAETHVQLVILVEATPLLLVMTAMIADHQVHRATVTNATTADHQVLRATASNATTADLLLHVDHVHKASVDHLVRASMN
jgi:phage terminase large subunit GpA-like protein